MDSYPDIPTDLQTSPSGESDAFKADRMGDGTFRVAIEFDDKLPMTVLHPLIEQSELDTLMAFYDANRALVFDFTYRGTTYSMIFGGRPQVRNASPTRYNVTVPLLPAA